MTQSSSKTWKLLKHLNNEKTQTKNYLNITTSQIAHNLIVNGKTRKRKSDIKINKINEGEVENFENPVIMVELQKAANDMNCKNSVGIDGIWAEEILKFESIIKLCTLVMFNDCQTKRFPKIWLKAKVIALHKLKRWVMMQVISGQYQCCAICIHY